MKPKPIFVVKGTTGEYSDRRTWLVCAFRTEEQAKGFVTTLSAKALELGISSSGASEWDEEEVPKLKAMQELDPQCDRVDYTGVRYFYTPTELR